MPHLVPVEISRAKLDRELEHWERQPELLKERGWILLQRSGLELDVAFAARVQLSSSPAPLPILAACIRLNYEDYDLVPPSLTFIDLFGGAPIMPHVRAIVADSKDLLVNGHPHTKLPFLCVPGTREYHSHPQHTGDSWLLHRERKAGSPIVLCDLVWRAMVRNVFGFRLTTQMLPMGGVTAQVDIRLGQGDVDALNAQFVGAFRRGAAGGPP